MQYKYYKKLNLLAPDYNSAEGRRQPFVCHKKLANRLSDKQLAKEGIDFEFKYFGDDILAVPVGFKTNWFKRLFNL